MTEPQKDVAAQAADAIQDLWQQVVQTVNKILEADNRFGFSHIHANLDPSIDQILSGLKLVEVALNSIIDYQGEPALDHDEVRTALNGKQCVLVIRRLALALADKDQALYQEAISLLDKQYKG